jgi:hypothetical protein
LFTIRTLTIFELELLTDDRRTFLIPIKSCSQALSETEVRGSNPDQEMLDEKTINAMF